MNAAEYRQAIETVGLNQREAAALLGVSLRSSQGYATGAQIPEPVSRLLAVMIAYQITASEVLRAVAPGRKARG